MLDTILVRKESKFAACSVFKDSKLLVSSEFVVHDYAIDVFIIEFLLQQMLTFLINQIYLPVI